MMMYFGDLTSTQACALAKAMIGCDAADCAADSKCEENRGGDGCGPADAYIFSMLADSNPMGFLMTMGACDELDGPDCGGNTDCVAPAMMGMRCSMKGKAMFAAMGCDVDSDLGKGWTCGYDASAAGADAMTECADVLPAAMAENAAAVGEAMAGQFETLLTALGCDDEALMIMNGESESILTSWAAAATAPAGMLALGECMAASQAPGSEPDSACVEAAVCVAADEDSSAVVAALLMGYLA